MGKAIAAGLCEGRHPLPVEMFIFGNRIDDPTDVDGLYTTANHAIPGEVTHIDLYVTGLTAATLAVCRFAWIAKFR